MGKLQNRVAFITGGAQGMGFGSALVMAREGAKVALVGKSDNVFSSADKLRADGYDAMGVKVDVRDLPGLKDAAAEVYAAWGRIDILVCCAGVGGPGMGDFLDDDAEQVRDFTMDVNVNGTWNACKAVLPYMVQAKYGKIVIYSSITGAMVTDPGMISYAMSKAAQVGFMRAIAMEYAHLNITANAVLPGSINTNLLNGMISHARPGEDPADVQRRMGMNIPIRRLGTIEEAGDLTAFLASDESRYITGATFVIDGGNSVPETPPVSWDARYGGPG